MASDLNKSKWIILGGAIFSIFVSFLFLLLVEKFATCIVWTCIITFLGGLLAGGIACLVKYF